MSRFVVLTVSADPSLCGEEAAMSERGGRRKAGDGGRNNVNNEPSNTGLTDCGRQTLPWWWEEGRKGWPPTMALYPGYVRDHIGTHHVDAGVS